MLTAQMPGPSSPLAVRILAGLGIGLMLKVGKGAFAPLFFSVLFALLLTPLVEALRRRRVPRPVGACATVGLLLLGLGLLADVTLQPAMQWVDTAPQMLQQIERKVRPLQRVFTRIDTVTRRASSLTDVATASPESAPAPASTATQQLNAAALLRRALVNTVSVAILTVFLLVGGGRMLQRCEAACVKDGFGSRWLPMIASVQTALSRYLSTIALINVGLGLATAGITTLWGLPNPWLWGALAFALNFIPYAGPAATLVILGAVALVTFEGFAVAGGVTLSFLLLTTIEGQIVQPLLVGYRLKINPIILFTAIWLAGWFWGVAGVLLITPVLIAVREMMAHNTAYPLVGALLNNDNPTASRLVTKL